MKMIVCRLSPLHLLRFMGLTSLTMVHMHRISGAFRVENERVEKVIHSQPSLLVQRTTPRKVGRRLIIGMTSDEFYSKHPRYFLENHINYIKVLDDENVNLLYGLMGWLNSDLINFVFQLRNGNTHISAFELGLLPVNSKMVEQFVDLTKTITYAETQEQNDLIGEPKRDNL